jgi:hypothetical protein
MPHSPLNASTEPTRQPQCVAAEPQARLHGGAAHDADACRAPHAPQLLAHRDRWRTPDTVEAHDLTRATSPDAP